LFRDLCDRLIIGESVCIEATTENTDAAAEIALAIAFAKQWIEDGTPIERTDIKDFYVNFFRSQPQELIAAVESQPIHRISPARNLALNIYGLPKRINANPADQIDIKPLLNKKFEIKLLKGYVKSRERLKDSIAVTKVRLVTALRDIIEPIGTTSTISAKNFFKLKSQVYRLLKDPRMSQERDGRSRGGGEAIRTLKTLKKQLKKIEKAHAQAPAYLNPNLQVMNNAFTDYKRQTAVPDDSARHAATVGVGSVFAAPTRGDADAAIAAGHRRIRGADAAGLPDGDPKYGSADYDSFEFT